VFLGVKQMKTTLKFKYKFPENFNPTYTNGVYGGIAPQGEIVMNFFFERPPLPYVENLQLGEEGQAVTPPTVIDPNDFDYNVIRFVSSGVIMNLDSAKAIHNWLGQKIQILEQMREENQ